MCNVPGWLVSCPICVSIVLLPHVMQDEWVLASPSCRMLPCRKKRATEAAKLVESARRWEKVDGSLGPTRGRGSAQPADAACPQAGGDSLYLHPKPELRCLIRLAVHSMYVMLIRKGCSI